MGLPPLRYPQIPSFTEADRKTLRFAQAKINFVGSGTVTNANAPIRCDANQVALIDEIVFTAYLNDAATNLTCTIHINGSTINELGATATVAAQDLPFRFPGIADATGVRRTDRLVLQPRGNMVVRPSSTLWVNASAGGLVGCHIKYRYKGLQQAINDGDIRRGGSLPQAASSNSIESGGTVAATQKCIVAPTGLSAGVRNITGVGASSVTFDGAVVKSNEVTLVIRSNSTGPGQIRTAISGVTTAGVNTLTVSPAWSPAIAADGTVEIIDQATSIEILGFYLTGHSWNAAADDIRLGYWDGVTGNFAANGSMVFRGWAQGTSNVFQPRLVIDDTRGCIQGPIGAGLYIQASANLAGATPPADYVVLYRRVGTTEVASTTGTIGATPTVRKKFWYYTQAASGAAPNPFFAATVTGDETQMIRIHGHAFSCTNADAGQTVIGLTFGAAGASLSEWALVGGDGDGVAASTTMARTGLNALVRKDLEPGFFAFEIGVNMTNRCQLAWGTFSAGADTAFRSTDISEL
jgi:hypothetical protein